MSPIVNRRERFGRGDADDAAPDVEDAGSSSSALDPPSEECSPSCSSSSLLIELLMITSKATGVGDLTLLNDHFHGRRRRGKDFPRNNGVAFSLFNFLLIIFFILLLLLLQSSGHINDLLKLITFFFLFSILLSNLRGKNDLLLPLLLLFKNILTLAVITLNSGTAAARFIFATAEAVTIQILLHHLQVLHLGGVLGAATSRAQKVADPIVEVIEQVLEVVQQRTGEAGGVRHCGGGHPVADPLQKVHLGGKLQ
ncbi:hypothetical protein TYRP_011839 [Tyrophagus putrescentiae]|nr:hypothetical protein TYRP_011839 [Tyrophagus putrescentiae]